MLRTADRRGDEVGKEGAGPIDDATEIDAEDRFELLEFGAGCLVNISSLNGVMAQGGLSAYVASKFAVRGFTESIRVEMLMAGYPVQVVVVHPGGVRTNIANAAMQDGAELPEEERKRTENLMRFYNEKLLKMAPEQAARLILDGVERGRSRIVITSQAIWLDRLVRFMPESYPRRVAAAQKKLVSRCMRHADQIPV